MKTILNSMLTVFLLALSCSALLAQQLKGIATYKVSSGVKISMDSTQMSPEMMSQMQAQMDKHMQKEFTLSFDQKSSSWKEVESLGSPGGSKIMIMGIGGMNDILYKDIQEARLERSTEVMGKEFLIRDELPQYGWQLTDETKQIGEYTCNKAVYSRVVDSRKFSTGMKEMEVVKDTVFMEAWYTAEIPVSHGPAEFWGLPGLILELKGENNSLICSKIVLNPKEGVEIEKPKKGKVVTQAEYQEIREEKMKDMMNKYQGPAGGDKVQFKIGN